MAIVAPECSLGDILVPHLDLMVPRPQIDFGEEIQSPQLIHQLINPGDGVIFLHGLLVERPVIDAHSQCAILLHQNNRRRKWASIRSNVS